MIQLVMLGTGTPNLDPTRFESAAAVVIDQQAYLIDCGAGVMQRIAAQASPALAPERLTRLFITHLHSDHTLGYIDVILSSWMYGRDQPLRVYGPPGLQAMTDHLLAAFAVDIQERIHGVEDLPADGYAVDVHEITPGGVPGVIYQDDRVVVTAFPVKHGGLQTFGYRLKTLQHTIVFSGDTIPVETVIEQAAGCDVLVHCAFSETQVRQRSQRSQMIHRALLTSAVQLGEIARRAQPQCLVLTHLHPSETADQLIAEVRQQYTGQVIIPHDGDVLALD